MQFPTGVSQRTWSATASEPITSGLLRGNVTAPLWLITSPPMAILAQQVTSQSFPSAVVQTVNPLDTELLDTGGGHNDAVNSFRFFIPTSGWWLFRGAVPYAPSTSSGSYNYMAGLEAFQGVNVASQYFGGRHPGPGSATAVPMPAFTELLPCTAQVPVGNGDHVQLIGWQDTGSAGSLPSNTSVGVFPWLAARWAGVLSGTAGLPVPSPAAFSDLTEITGAFLNANVRDAVNFLAFPPMVRLSNVGGSQSIPSGGDTAVNWTTSSINPTGTASVNSDNYGGWSSGTNPSRYTFPVAGRYYVSGQVATSSVNTGQWAAGLRVNGTTSYYGTRTNAPVTSTLGMNLTSERYLRVNAGDYVEVTIAQSTGSASPLAISAPVYSRLIALWRGA